MISYKNLFSIQCLHGYYSRGKSADLRFEPTAECMNLIKNYGLAFRPNPTGFRLAYQSEEGVKHLLEMIREPLTFSFVLRNINPYFINITEIPFSDSETVFYFNNRDLKVKNDEKALNQAEIVTEADQVRMVSPGFSFPLEAFPLKGKADVEDITGQTVHSFAYENPPGDLLQVDMRKEPFGLYQLKLNKKPALRFYTSNLPAIKCFGIMEIQFGDLPSKAGQLRLNGKLQEQEFVIRFGPRATTWKYFVVSRENAFDQYEVVNGSKKGLFSKAKPVTLATGDAAILLQSEKPISFQEFSREKYKLKLTRKGDPAEMSLDLPSPDTSVIKPDPGTGAIYSEMYIYV
jgi:hypothetical protein